MQHITSSPFLFDKNVAELRILSIEKYSLYRNNFVSFCIQQAENVSLHRIVTSVLGGRFGEGCGRIDLVKLVNSQINQSPYSHEMLTPTNKIIPTNNNTMHCDVKKQSCNMFKPNPFFFFDTKSTYGISKWSTIILLDVSVSLRDKTFSKTAS